jgi:hypothetical protein
LLILLLYLKDTILVLMMEIRTHIGFIGFTYYAGSDKS